jgi:hypothetical protein
MLNDRWQIGSRSAAVLAIPTPGGTGLFAAANAKRAVNITAQIETPRQRYFPNFPLVLADNAVASAAPDEAPQARALGETGRGRYC